MDTITFKRYFGYPNDSSMLYFEIKYLLFYNYFQSHAVVEYRLQRHQNLK